ncbi:MAG: Ldh family oxidoreductase [Hyphomicrobiales bacterium]|jgi:L-2-hydroxycarboxylate dehydrogenase (NAD+)|nr:Ldh family oxidoreductase [Hyphomicrobiales bacterium]
MVETAALPEGTKRHDPIVVKNFLSTALIRVGVEPDDADLVSDVLVAADLRGVRSHGAARLSYFIVRLEKGTLNLNPKMDIKMNSKTTGLLDAENGIGIIAANKAMQKSLEIAEEYGTGFIGVANSSHFGFAGYWSDLAMKRGFIGISMSNSGGRTTPTYARESMLGTNPMSVAIPGGESTDFLLDMATTTVAVGKIETALREGRDVKEGWVSPMGDTPELDANGVLTYGAPLLPLGGAGMESGGHKGYGLNLMVELLCGAVTGTSFADRIKGARGNDRPAMGHLMGAIRLDGFRDPIEIQKEMNATYNIIRNAKKEPDQDRVYIHGEPEAIAIEENSRLGIPITQAVYDQLEKIAERYGINSLPE